MTNTSTQLPDVVNVLVLADIVTDDELKQIAETGGARTKVERGKAPGPELETQLRAAHVLYLGSSGQKDMRLRAPGVIWAHFNFAGVSNLRDSTWWEAPVTLTSSRGLNHPLPLAESVIAAAYMFARGLDVAVRNTDARDFKPASYGGNMLVTGKTMGIIGLGGIGQLVAQIARGCGMRVVASRRSAGERAENVDGVDVLYPPSDLHALLSESDFVAVCAMSTPETTGMLDAAAIAAMKDGVYIINVARGDLIVEDEMIKALDSGKIAGAYLDVFGDSIFEPPTETLANARNVVLAPHTSNRADSPQSFSVDLFCENLTAFLAGRQLKNVIDWARGY
jgi:phosphoglycerate dehydrogenase-like enzyme